MTAREFRRLAAGAVSHLATCGVAGLGLNGLEYLARVVVLGLARLPFSIGIKSGNECRLALEAVAGFPRALKS